MRSTGVREIGVQALLLKHIELNGGAAMLHRPMVEILRYLNGCVKSIKCVSVLFESTVNVMAGVIQCSHVYGIEHLSILKSAVGRELIDFIANGCIENLKTLEIECNLELDLFTDSRCLDTLESMSIKTSGTLYAKHIVKFLENTGNLKILKLRDNRYLTPSIETSMRIDKMVKDSGLLSFSVGFCGY